MNILAIGAHPDDIEYGCAGTLLEFKKRGHSINFIIFTDGGNWRDKNSDTRINEQLLACDNMEVDDVIWMGAQDGNIKTDVELIDKIEKIILEKNIDVVFCNYPNDTHQDHIELANIVRSASRFSKNLLFYEALTSTGFEPNFYMDIGEFIDKKIDILKSFKSQINKYEERGIDYLDMVKIKNKLYGFKSYCSYAEGFSVGRLCYNNFFDKV